MLDANNGISPENNGNDADKVSFSKVSCDLHERNLAILSKKNNISPEGRKAMREAKQLAVQALRERRVQINLHHMLLRERWIKEGRWRSEVKGFIQKVKEQIRSGAKNMQGWQVNDMAYETAKENFPPLAPDQMPEPILRAVEREIVVNDASSPDQLRTDMQWVYNNLNVSRLSEDQAPTPGAYNLWIWARKNKGKFIEKLLSSQPKPKTPKEKVEEQEERDDRHSTALDMLELDGT